MREMVFNPKVSIIIPVYNGANYIREAIDSALAQTYENCEVIVVNDGSTDNGETEKIVKSYGNKVRYFLKDNGGVSSALNYGIKEMGGDYFSWLSHDDKYTPFKVEHLVELLKRVNEKNVIALSGLVFVDYQSNIVKKSKNSLEKNRLYSGKEVVSYILQHGTLNGCAMLIPKEAFHECGLFNETLRYNQDSLMWYTIFGKGYKLIVDNNEDVMYRLHATQTSKLRRDLLLHDSFEMSKIIVPMFIKSDYKGTKFLKLYARRNARHDCKDAVNYCIEEGRRSNIFTTKDVVQIRLWELYGKLRNIIKRIYHRTIK